MMDSEKDRAEQAKSGRRSFLKVIWAGLGLVALAETAGVIFAYLRPKKQPATEGAFGGVISAGAVDGFEKDSVTAFRRGHFYLVRYEDGGFLALSRKCTHLGCTVPWVESEQQFKCPCHASSFNKRGEVLEAPAPRPLDIFEISIENGIVQVNTDKKIRRSQFEPSQVSYL